MNEKCKIFIDKNYAELLSERSKQLGISRNNILNWCLSSLMVTERVEEMQNQLRHKTPKEAFISSVKRIVLNCGVVCLSTERAARLTALSILDLLNEEYSIINSTTCEEIIVTGDDIGI